MESGLDALILLTRRYAFAEVAALLAQGMGGSLTDRSVAELQQLCAFGQRLLDLDAEDFGEPDAARDANTEHEIADRIGDEGVPGDLVERALRCRMPQSAKERHRGALGSLKPAYALLLEVIEARFVRRETTAVVAAVHIASEYAPLLAWEAVLGHAGDPLLLPLAVQNADSAWGVFEDRRCPHTKAEKSAAKRVLTVARDNTAGWRSYLDRQHSNMAHALGVCAVNCHQPCFVYTHLSPQEAQTVTDGSRLALALNDSAIVRLRHSAPVGHGFGVPSRRELRQAWDRTRTSLARLHPAVTEEDGFVLPGFVNLIATIAGQDLSPGTLIADTAAQISRRLRADPPAPAARPTR